MKKSSAIAAMIWKPLSSDGSDHSDCSDNDRWDRLQFYLSDRGDRSDHMEATLQRSHSASQRPQIKSTGMHCVRSRFSKWLPRQTSRKQSSWHFFWKKYKNTTVCTSNFQRNIETSTRKSTAGKQSERNSIYFPNTSSLSFPSTMITRKHTSSRSRQFTAAMLNLRNGANYVVRPRSPRSSFSDCSDHMETINRCDRWTIFVSGHSDGSDHMENRI